MSDYPHLTFSRRWTLNGRIQRLLGECEAFVSAISNTPILPQIYGELKRVAFIKGAQSTTAIEGNTLTEEEIGRIDAGESLEPSKAYQEQEIKNILDALNTTFEWTLLGDESIRVNKSLILAFHKMVGKELGEHFDAIPGELRTDDRAVGPYRCPDYRLVDGLLDQLVEWLPKEFGFNRGRQTFDEAVVEAIVTHVYLEWIHPFGDGNGRTGRLLEFYILTRHGFPDVASHLLSNHYNRTRPEYYRLLNKARTDNDLTQFIDYALVGLRDGLKATLLGVQQSQRDTTWQKHIYDAFDKRPIKNKSVFKRRRNLALHLPTDRAIPTEKIPLVTPEIARDYGQLSSKTLSRDLDVLLELELITRDGNGVIANIGSISQFSARRRVQRHSTDPLREEVG